MKMVFTLLLASLVMAPAFAADSVYTPPNVAPGPSLKASSGGGLILSSDLNNVFGGHQTSSSSLGGYASGITLIFRVAGNGYVSYYRSDSGWHSTGRTIGNLTGYIIGRSCKSGTGWKTTYNDTIVTQVSNTGIGIDCRSQFLNWVK